MPHIDIKCFPRELDEQQKAALAADITDVIIRQPQRSSPQQSETTGTWRICCTGVWTW